MAPKKAQKMALTDFLQDESLGSWADEMDNMPDRPLARTDEDRTRGRDFGNRDRFDDYPNRESRFPPREELPLPTAPPYTAFIGNLAFDVRENDIEDFFSPAQLKSVKIIKDREEKPKGFGYVEFETLQGLKDGIAKTGSQMVGRTVRVSVAEPPKDRPGREGGGFDDDRLAGPWRRDGPPPGSDRGGFRGGSRYGSEDRGGPSRDREPPTEAEQNTDWRASARPPPVRGPPVSAGGMDRPGPPSRKASGFVTPESHPADTDQVWQRGAKFSPAEPEKSTFAGKGPFFGRRESGNRPVDEDPTDWRAAPRKQAPPTPQNNGRHSNERSPSGSVPSTPNMGRRKLELLPRTSNQSNATSPVGSPKASTPTAILHRANPFGDARPVDAAAREKEVEERLARDKEARHKDREAAAASKSNETSPRTRPSDRPAPRAPPGEAGSWRERKPSAQTLSQTSRPGSATHSRATSNDANQLPSPGGSLPGKKQSAHFSFAAIASDEIPLVEGQDDDEAEEHKLSEVSDKVTELTV